jgi:hypothetical protein
VPLLQPGSASRAVLLIEMCACAFPVAVALEATQVPDAHSVRGQRALAKPRGRAAPCRRVRWRAERRSCLHRRRRCRRGHCCASLSTAARHRRGGGGGGKSCCRREARRTRESKKRPLRDTRAAPSNQPRAEEINDGHEHGHPPSTGSTHIFYHCGSWWIRGAVSPTSRAWAPAAPPPRPAARRPRHRRRNRRYPRRRALLLLILLLLQVLLGLHRQLCGEGRAPLLPRRRPAARRPRPRHPRRRRCRAPAPPPPTPRTRRVHRRRRGSVVARPPLVVTRASAARPAPSPARPWR